MEGKSKSVLKGKKHSNKLQEHHQRSKHYDESSSENDKSARPLWISSKPAQYGDADVGGVLESSVEENSFRNITSVKKHKRKSLRRRRKSRVQEAKEKPKEQRISPQFDSEISLPPPQHIPVSPKGDGNHSIESESSEENNNVCLPGKIVPSNSLFVSVIPPKKKWERMKEAFESTVTRQVTQIGRRFSLDFSHSTRNKPMEIIPAAAVVEVKSPKIIPPRTVAAGGVAQTVPPISVSLPPQTPPKKFSILDLRKSRAERGVKSLNMQMSISFVFRKDKIRRSNNKGKINKTIMDSAETRPSEVKHQLPFKELPHQQQEQSYSSNNTVTHPMNYNNKNLLFSNPNPNHFDFVKNIPDSENTTYSKILDKDESKFNNIQTRFSDVDLDELSSPCQYYPKTPFTAQFAHLLPISHY